MIEYLQKSTKNSIIFRSCVKVIFSFRNNLVDLDLPMNARKFKEIIYLVLRIEIKKKLVCSLKLQQNESNTIYN